MNPFDGNGPAPNPYDLPLNLGQRGQVVSQSHQTVLFDAAAQTASPAGKAMLDWLLGKMQAAAFKRHQETVETVSHEMADIIGPLIKRIETLEAQLQVERERNAQTIQTALVGFLDDGPDLAELERMAEVHKKERRAG